LAPTRDIAHVKPRPLVAVDTSRVHGDPM